MIDQAKQRVADVISGLEALEALNSTTRTSAAIYPRTSRLTCMIE